MRRAGRRASFCASHFALVVALVCGQSRDFRVCRRVTRHVPNRARVGVFCFLRDTISVFILELTPTCLGRDYKFISK